MDNTFKEQQDFLVRHTKALAEIIGNMRNYPFLVRFQDKERSWIKQELDYLNKGLSDSISDLQGLITNLQDDLFERIYKLELKQISKKKVSKEKKKSRKGDQISMKRRRRIHG